MATNREAGWLRFIWPRGWRGGVPFLVGFLFIVSPVQRTLAAPLSAPEYQFIAMVNEDRRLGAVKSLDANSALSALARARSEQMLSSGVFGHYDAQGRLIFADMLTTSGFPFLWAGENLEENGYAWPVSLSVADRGLMNSPGHRANILDPRFDEIGVGIAGPGPHGEFYYTQIFAQTKPLPQGAG